MNQKVVKKYHSLGWAFSLVELSILLKNGQNRYQNLGRGDKLGRGDNQGRGDNLGMG